MKILLASTNPGKLREYRELLTQVWPEAPAGPTWASTHLELVDPLTLGIHLHVEENGSTFEENAVIKATAFARASGLFALADDSGLEIDALGGEPGIMSARYDGPTDADRNRAVLAKLTGVPVENRTARYRCVVALASPQDRYWTGHGTCEGLIAFAPRGRQGFGYDPIFFLPEFHRTMAQIPRSLKNRISHRAAAFRSIYPIIVQFATSERLG